MVKYPCGNYREYVLSFYPDAYSDPFIDEEGTAHYEIVGDQFNFWGAEYTEEKAWELAALCIYHELNGTANEEGE